MKYLESNGRRLNVYDARLVMRLVPVEPGGMVAPACEVVEDDAARERVRALLASGRYRKEAVTKVG